MRRPRPATVVRRVARNGVKQGTPQQPLSWYVRFIVIPLGIVLLLPLFLLIVAGIVLFWPFVALLRWWSKRRFMARHAGQMFVLVTRRHGWKDLVDNNIIPALPPGATCVWDDYGAAREGILRHVSRRAVIGRRRPYLIEITGTGMRVVPLHEQLLPLKARSRKSAEVRAEVSAILRRTLGPEDPWTLGP